MRHPCRIRLGGRFLTVDAEDSSAKSPRGGTWISRVVLVVFVVSVVVNLEGWFHAFDYLDELTLSMLRASGTYASSELVEASGPPADGCVAGAGKYVAVLLPQARATNQGVALPTAAKVASGADFPLEVIQALYDQGPSVIAVDLDLSGSVFANFRARALTAEKGLDAPASETRLALAVYPISGEDETSQKRRLQRNAWLRQVCASHSVALASPDVYRSVAFGDVGMYFGERVHPSTDSEAPLNHPSLGLVASQLDMGQDAHKTVRRAGYLCHQVVKRQTSARIPFADEPRTNLDLNDEAFVDAGEADSRYALAWLNPSTLNSDIHTVKIETPQDLARVRATAPARNCLANKVVFVGTARGEFPRDVFATMAGQETPGVIVHAMVAASSERKLNSALALYAGVDVVAGYLLLALFSHLDRTGFGSSSSFVVRAVYRLLQSAAPLVVIAIIGVGSILLFRHDWFMNPLIALVGIWLHGVLHEYFKWRPAPAPAGVKNRLARAYYRVFPQPDFAPGTILGMLDRLAYGGVLCLLAISVAFAVYVLCTRTHLGFS